MESNNIRMSLHKESDHDRIQNDWDNREFIEVVTTAIGKMSSFINEFDASCRYKLAKLNEKLEILHRRMDYIEGRIGQQTSL